MTRRRRMEVDRERPPWLDGRPTICIDEARRAATRNRLIGEGVTEPTADAWIAAWEAQAAEDGVERGSGYWEAAWVWIAAQRKDLVRP